MRQVLRGVRVLQADPVNVVARNQLLVLWSRLGGFDRVGLDTLLWREQWLFEYWAHAASIVLTEDYPVHQLMMRQYREIGETEAQHAWLAANDDFRRYVLDLLAGSLSWSRAGTGYGGYGPWLTNPATEPLPTSEAVARAAERSLRALGVARARDVERHFTIGRYPGLDLERASWARPVRVPGGTEQWWVHRDVLGRLDEEWVPRTTLLSPFDNLICDRDRTERLWGFAYRNEMYVRKATRQFGYYVLPVLAGERLIGRIAARADRKQGVFAVEAMFAEESFTGLPEQSVAAAIDSLASFAGTASVTYAGSVALGVS
jgi:uncharacterized protein YcaQ